MQQCLPSQNCHVGSHCQRKQGIHHHIFSRFLESPVTLSQHTCRWRSPCQPLGFRCVTTAGSIPPAAEARSSAQSTSSSSASGPSHAPQEVDVRQILSDPAIEGDPLHFLKVTEAYWKALRNSQHNPGKRGPTVVSKRYKKLGGTEYDVCVAGGTLGLFLALALQLKGHSVCIVERRLVEGRSQEWNVSRAELAVLASLGLMTHAEVDAAIVSEWNPVRVGFKGSESFTVDNVLNTGVDPRYLIQRMRERFLAAGGAIFERTNFTAAETAPDGILVKVSGSGASSPATVGDTNRPSVCRPEDMSAAQNGSQDGASSNGSEGSSGTGSRKQEYASANGSSNSSSNGRSGKRKEIRARLLVDCCGHYSPIVKQMRGGSKPSAMVLVVGACADGVPPELNRHGDLLYTFTDVEDDLQLFWEAFPTAGGGRTTYMFAYADADARRPSFEELLQKYFQLLPQYQGVPLEQLKLRRVLFGGFPCYQDAPLRTHFDRVLQIGDAAAAQSPLSFGGFGAMLRHLPRLSTAVDDALRCDRLKRRDLAMLQPYQPSLSASWLFQRSMSMRVGEVKSGTSHSSSQRRRGTPPNHVNRLMRCNFSVMRLMGDWVLRPFLQDTIRFLPLAVSMLGMSFRDPLVVMRVVSRLGPKTLLTWVRHYFALAVYSLLHTLFGRWAASSGSFRLRRWAEAWRWGSGHEYAPSASSRHDPATSRGWRGDQDEAAQGTNGSDGSVALGGTGSERGSQGVPPMPAPATP